MRLPGTLICAAVVACVPTERPDDGNNPGVPSASAALSQTAQTRAAPTRAVQTQASKAETKRKARPRRSRAARSGSGARDPELRGPFSDTFDRDALGTAWLSTSDTWQLKGGQLCAQGARNHPVWLKRRLPTNARIEFDAVSRSVDGDIKLEVWGDGRSYARTTSYTNASSYIVIFGGWKNQFHVIARIDEHGDDRKELRIGSSNTLRSRRVMPGQRYHFKLERSDGKTLRWLVDDIEILSFHDGEPLTGSGHDHFGFNDWDVPVCFDNLKITPLEG